MTVNMNPTALDEQRLMDFVFRAVDEVGAALNAALVVLGDKVGWYRALADNGPLTPEELAAATQTALPYVREWLNAQAAGSYVDYDTTTGRYALPAEHAVALTDASSAAYLPGLFQIAIGTIIGSERLVETARSGGGVGWQAHTSDVHDGCERFFRPSYQAYLVDSWLPSVGVVDRLREGTLVADVGCGYGASTILMAEAFPRSRFIGFDLHAPSIDVARRRAAEAGVTERVSFEVGSATDFTGGNYDLITMFDSLHDMGDPVGAAHRVRSALADGGTWMIVEPMAGDRVEENFHAVGRVYYGFSTLLCTPASLSQEVGRALGTQAGPARIQEVVNEAGFTHFRSAAETPFHRVLEVRA